MGKPHTIHTVCMEINFIPLSYRIHATNRQNKFYLRSGSQMKETFEIIVPLKNSYKQKSYSYYNMDEI